MKAGLKRFDLGSLDFTIKMSQRKWTNELPPPPGNISQISIYGILYIPSAFRAGP